MELFTLNRLFQKQYLIDGFESLIWTERYAGDGDVKIVVPTTREMITKLPEGTFVTVNDTDEVMIIEQREIGKENITLSGISFIPWLDNRFIRTSANQEDRYWYLSGAPAGEVLWLIVYNMCVAGSPYLDGSINTGVLDPTELAIPGLELGAFDTSGEDISVGIPFGPVYSSGLKDLAATYELGMRIVLFEVNPVDNSYSLRFYSYKGDDHTSLQDILPVVRFSPNLDSLTDIKELQSIANLKTIVYAFAPFNPEGLAVLPGVSTLDGIHEGFDLRAMQVFADDITTDQVDGSTTDFTKILSSRAQDALRQNYWVKAVDGEIVPDNIYKYGRDYKLGDLVEVEGYTEVLQTARVTEYIRSQDSTGEKAYPTVTTLDSGRSSPSRPPNDDLENAQLITCPGDSTDGTNLYATNQVGETYEGAGMTVWYHIIPGFDTEFTITPTGIGVRPLGQPRIVLFLDTSGGEDHTPFSFATLDELASEDNTLTYTLLEGNSYYISIDTGNGRPGNFDLAWVCGDPTLLYTLQEITFGGFEGPPTSMFRGEMVYDTVREVAILPPTLDSADGLTWEYEQFSGWHPIDTPTTPPRLIDQPACYDEANSNVVVYHHTSDSLTTRETWTYDGNGITGEWTQIWSESFDPTDLVFNQPKVVDANMVYMASLGKVVLVGAPEADVETDMETWTWDGAVWEQLTPDHAPPGEIEFSMAYDSVRDRIVLVTRRASGPGADTWEFDGTDWEMVLSDSPDNWQKTEMAFDTTINKCILIFPNFPGGSGNWIAVYDGTGPWQNQGPTTGPGGWGHQFCNYPPYSGTLLFGGEASADHPEEGDPRTWFGTFTLS